MAEEDNWFNTWQTGEPAWEAIDLQGVATAFLNSLDGANFGVDDSFLGSARFVSWTQLKNLLRNSHKNQTFKHHRLKFLNSKNPQTRDMGWRILKGYYDEWVKGQGTTDPTMERNIKRQKLLASKSRVYFDKSNTMSELKAWTYEDSSMGFSNHHLHHFGAWGTIKCMNLINQGTSFSERVGDRIYISSAWFSFCMTMKRTTGGYEGWCMKPNQPQTDYKNSGTIKYWIIWDKLPTDTPVAISNILRNGTLTSPINLQNRNRFKVLYTHYHDYNVAITDDGGNRGCYHEHYVKFPKPSSPGALWTQFDSATPADSSDLRRGGLYLMIMMTAEPVPQVDHSIMYRGHWRVRYKG